MKIPIHFDQLSRALKFKLQEITCKWEGREVTWSVPKANSRESGNEEK